MASNIEIRISADVVDLQAKFAIAKAESSALTSELNKLAKQAAAAGGDMSSELKASLTQAAEASAAAKGKISDLGAQIKSLRPPAEEAGGGMGLLKGAVELLGPALGALGLATSVEGIIEFGKAAFTAAAQVDHAAAVAGVGAEALQAYRAALVETGASEEDADTLVRQLTRSIGVAIQTVGPARQAFVELGLSVGDLKGGSEKVWPLVAQGLLNIKDASERARLEFELFHRSGQEIEPALRALATPTDELKQKSRDLGQSLNPELTHSMQETQSHLSESWKRIGNDVTPVIQGIEDGIAWLLDHSRVAISIAVFHENPNEASERDNFQRKLLNDHWEPGQDDLIPGIDAPPAKAPPPPPQFSTPNFDAYNQSLQIAANLAGETARQRAIDTALITQANNLLKDQGHLEKDNVTTVAAARSVLGDKASGVAQTAAQGFDGSQKQIDQARKVSDEIAQIHTQQALHHIETEQQTNEFLLAMGQETLDQFKAQALKLEDDRYKAQLAGLQRREAADKGNAAALAKDQAEEAGLIQEHEDRVLGIKQQYAQKSKQIQQTELQDFIQQEQSKLATAIAADEALFKAGAINQQQRHDLEVQLTQAIEKEVLDRWDAEHSRLVKGTDDYANAMKERAAIVAGFSQKVSDADNKLFDAEEEKWKQLSRDIRSSFNSALDGLIFEGNTLKQFFANVAKGVAESFLQMGEKIAEDWVEQQIRMLVTAQTTEAATTAAAITGQAAQTGATATGTAAREAISARENGSFLGRIFSQLARWLGLEAEKTTVTATSTAAQVSTVAAGEAAKTGAVAAGTAAQTAIKTAGAAAGNAAEAAADSTSILNSAYTAAASAFKWVMQEVPWPLNAVLAPVAAGVTFAAVAAFDVISASGGAERIGADGQIVEAHRDESVLPARVSLPLMSFVGDLPAIAEMARNSASLAPFPLSFSPASIPDLRSIADVGSLLPVTSPSASVRAASAPQSDADYVASRVGGGASSSRAPVAPGGSSAGRRGDIHIHAWDAASMNQFFRKPSNRRTMDQISKDRARAGFMPG